LRLVIFCFGLTLYSSLSLFSLQVKSFREQATAGQIGDQARRDQAAEMALRLAQMMGFDESDSDDSS